MKLNIKKFPLLADDATRKIFHAFSMHGAEARFVGGCVRDALSGVEARDIDIAVPLPPDTVMEILEKAHIRVIPTGYNFGTLTACLMGRNYQITSLRKDLQTDGRHAQVIYGTGWREDAARRDFTMNALYADSQGNITDYFGGIEDLKAGIIRFIGNAHDRIQEDYLRILRYFRFLAWYGSHLPDHRAAPNPDAKAFQACRDLKEGINTLSRERIGQELMKLLAARFPLQSLSLMAEGGVVPCILPGQVNLTHLKTLLCLEDSPQPLLRLAALCLPQMNPKGLAKALRLSSNQLSYLEKCLSRMGFYPSSAQTVSRNLYRDGTRFFVDLTLLGLAINPCNEMKETARVATQASRAWIRPAFPLSGKDLINAGFNPGPRFGMILQNCENWWIDQEFKPAFHACLEWATHKMRNGS